MAITTLDQVKGKLYELFNEASVKHKSYEDPARGAENSYALNNHAVQNRIAMAALAQAIASVEREQREQPATPARLKMNKL